MARGDSAGSSTTREPLAVCPNCGNEFTVHDAFECVPGSTTECPGCDKTLHLIEEITVRTWTWSLRKDGDES